MPTSSINDQIHQLLAGGQEVMGRLHMSFQVASAATDSIFYTRRRVKSIDSVYGKISERQRRYGEPYSLADITDIVGYRFVTLYDDQLVEVIEWALQTLQRATQSPKPIIANGKLTAAVREIKAFPRSNSKEDLYAKALEAAKKQCRVKKALVVKESAEKTHYSSLHILLGLTSYSSGQLLSIPTEIQFRTALEDIWAEISHNNEYKAARPNIWAPSIEEKIKQNTANVRILKKYIDGGLPSAIDNIRKTTTDLQLETERVASLANYKSGSLVMDQVVAVAQGYLNQDSTNAVSAYTASLETLSEKFASSKDVSIDQAILALERLRSVISCGADAASCVEGLLDFEACRLDLLANRLQQENAIDERSSEKVAASLQASARKIYNKIEAIARRKELRHKSICLFEFWLYYAARYAGLRDLSVTHLLAAHQLLSSDPAVPSDCTLRNVVLRLIAQMHWANADSASRHLVDPKHPVPALRQYVLDEFKRALELTVGISKAKYDRDDLLFGGTERQRIIDLNNLVQYAADCVRWAQTDKVLTECGFSRGEWEHCFTHLKDSVSHVDLRDVWNVKHTLMVALVVLERDVEAAELAKELTGKNVPPRWVLDKLTERLQFDVDSIQALRPQRVAKRPANGNSGTQSSRRTRKPRGRAK